MERILVLGSEGFAGKALTRALLSQKNVAVFSVDLVGVSSDRHHVCDLTDKKEIARIVKDTNPNSIVNFAGSFSNDYETDYAANVLVLKHVLDALLASGSAQMVKILAIGSAAEYGLAHAHARGITESDPLHPVTMYGLTKAFQTELARYYHRAHDMHILIGRTFNLLGYHLNERLFVGRFLAQAKKLKKGDIKRIEMGNLEAYRDYVDVQDAADAYNLILRKGKAGEVYNVGSGKPVKMKELVLLLMKHTGIDEKDLIHQQIRSRFDVPCSYADLEKLAGIGYRPKVSLEESVRKIARQLDRAAET